MQASGEPACAACAAEPAGGARSPGRRAASRPRALRLSSPSGERSGRHRKLEGGDREMAERRVVPPEDGPVAFDVGLAGKRREGLVQSKSSTFQGRKSLIRAASARGRSLPGGAAAGVDESVGSSDERLPSVPIHPDHPVIAACASEKEAQAHSQVGRSCPRANRRRNHGGAHQRCPAETADRRRDPGRDRTLPDESVGVRLVRTRSPGHRSDVREGREPLRDPAPELAAGVYQSSCPLPATRSDISTSPPEVSSCPTRSASRGSSTHPDSSIAVRRRTDRRPRGPVRSAPLGRDPAPRSTSRAA